MKKLIAITAASALIVGLSTSFAQAGSARRHIIEGVIVGTGVALLGTAIAHSRKRPVPVMVKTVSRHHEDRYARHHKKHRKERWEVQKIWVEPIYERRWNPGHYNKRGRWISGRHQEFLVAEGHWKKERVRVRRHTRKF